MQLIAAVMATLALAQGEPAVTVGAPDATATIGRAELARWAKATTPEGALRTLIRTAWYDLEARERGIVITAAQLRERMAAEDRPEPLTREDLARHVRGLLAAEAMKEPIATAAAQSVTPEEIDAYVRAHPRTEPEERTLRIVVARTKRDAQTAKRKLNRGVTWRTVLRRYSAPDGGLRRRITREELPSALRGPVFAAKPGRLIGPISTRRRHFLVKVVKVFPERPTPLNTQRATAWEILAGEAQQRALTEFESALAAKWRPRTVCAPDLAAHEDCGNRAG